MVRKCEVWRCFGNMQPVFFFLSFFPFFINRLERKARFRSPTHKIITCALLFSAGFLFFRGKRREGKGGKRKKKTKQAGGSLNTSSSNLSFPPKKQRSRRRNNRMSGVCSVVVFSLAGEGDLHVVGGGDLEVVQGLLGDGGLRGVVELHEGDARPPVHQPSLLEARVRLKEHR